jgi:hypothetical protein
MEGSMKCPLCDGEGWYQTRATGGGPAGLNIMILLGFANPCLWCKETGKVSFPHWARMYIPAKIIKLILSRRIINEYNILIKKGDRE